MSINKLLKRQIKKHLTDELLEKKAIRDFIDAVNETYNTHEREHTLSSHAFKVSEEEFFELNEQLQKEISLKKRGIRNLKETIKSIEGPMGGGDLINIEEDNLMDALDYLREQVYLRNVVEHELEDSRTHHATAANRLKQLIANLNDGILVEDEHGKIVLVNQLFCDMFSIKASPESMTGKASTDHVEKSKKLFKAPGSFVSHIKDILSKRQLVTAEEFDLADGRVFKRDYVPIEINNEYKGHLWRYTDITEEKQAKKELERLSVVASTNENGVIFTGPDGRIFWANDGFARLSGYEREEIIGKTPIELCKGPLTDKDNIQRMLDSFYTGKSFDVELVHYRKDGTWFWGRDRGQCTLDENGKVLQYFAMVENISELKEKEHALQMSEVKYRGIIENMNLGMMELNAHGQIIYANQSFCDISGYTRDELLGKRPSALFLRKENKEIAEKKNTKPRAEVYELAVKNKRGEAKWWLVSDAPLFDKNGDQIGSIGIHLDLTPQKEMETQLIEAKKEAEDSARAKEIFMANMSHEIRTPMNGIMGMTRQLYKTGISNQQRFYLDTISLASENLLVILNDILDLSKIESGKLYLENVGFKLDEILGTSIQVLIPKAEEKGIALKTMVDSRISDVLIGDPHRLNQLFLNLIGNAVKFTHKGTVSVKCSMESERGGTQFIRFAVHDTGIGMTPEYIRNIFEKFTQEDKSTARKYGGTGLGMNISKHLVELMGGKINVQSEKGKGTTVDFTIPLIVGTEKDLPSPLEYATSDFSELNGKRVLLAEDNELNQLVVTSSLDHYGLATAIANNGLEALEALRSGEFDIVLMDIQMPDMDGYETTRKLRNELKLDIPVIALTANAIKGENEKCFEAGMTDFLPKPFDENDLLALLVKHLVPNKQVRISGKTRATESASAYNLNKLKQISRGNDQFLRKMIGIFKKQSLEVLADMRTAHARGDIPRMRKIAHKLKPSLDNLDIKGFMNEIRQLEKWDEKDGESARIKELLDQLEQTLHIVHTGLDAELAEMAGQDAG